MAMKRLLLVLVAVLMAVAFSARDSQALTLGYPDINYDTQSLSGGGLTFNAATGDLTVTASLVALTTLPGPTTTNPGGTVTYTMNLSSVSSSGGVTTGTFGDSSLVNDLVIVDGSSTTLLTGNFITANITGVNGMNIGAGSATFQVTGGTLAANFLSNCTTSNCGGMVNLVFNLGTNFSSTMYASNFTGAAKGDIAPVPEPSTLLLLGSGFIGAGFWFRRRRA